MPCLKHVSAAGWQERLYGNIGIAIISFGLVCGLGWDGRFVCLGMMIGVGFMLARATRTQLRLAPKPGAALLCSYEVQLTESGMRAQTPRWTTDVPWHGILAIEETAGHCFLRIDTASVYTIPKRAFPDEPALRQFIDFAREGVSRARS